MVVAPDGTWLATAATAVIGDDGVVRIWDLATGRQTATLTGRLNLLGGPWGPDLHIPPAMAIAPDGTWLATASGTTVRIWDPATGQQTGGLTGHTSQIVAVAIAPDGTWLATADDEDAGMVRIWDPATGRQTRALAGYTGKVTAIVIAPDSTWLATASGWERTVRIWDPVTGQQTAALTGHMPYGEMTSISISPDGTWLVTVDDGAGGAAQIWELATGQPRTVDARRLFGPTIAAIAPDGTWLATASDHGMVRIWDPATGRQTRTLTGHTDKVTALTIAPDGTWLATASGSKVRIWDPATGQQTGALSGHTGKVTAVAIAPDGTWLATADDRDKTVRIWDKSSSQVLTTMRTDAVPLSCTWMPDSSGLVVSSEHGVYFYEFHLGAPGA